MNGLAAYRPIRRYQSGGSISGDIGSLGGLNAPVDIGLGAFNPTPIGIAAAVSPVGLGARTANAVLSAFNALSAMTQAQQEPAPVEEASVNTIADIAVSPVAAPTAPTETAISAPSMGLAAMTAAEQAQQQAQQEPTDPSVVETVADIADISDAEAGAAVAAAQAAAAQSAATAASDSGPATGTGAGAPSDASVSGANSEASHDADGNNSGGGGTSGGCFLTTAAVNYMGEDDNGDVLNTLRDFRDTYMRRDKEKSKDVDWYYTNAPRIMRALDGRRDAPSVYREMYVDYIEPAYEAIKAGKDKEAYGIYRNLVNFAKRKSGIENEALTPKPKHMAQGGLASYGASMNSANFPMEMRYQSGGMTPVAQSVANQGRMGDSMMVHMNPMEVAGLQALARSQGTSMTINPQTGMPEAFNLSAALPFLAGMALNAFAPGVGSAIGSALGTSGAVGTGLAVGGATALGTGSLKKGLMAGLGAYGGAGLGEGLVSTATPTTPPGMDGALGTGVTQTAAAPTLPGADVTTSNLTNVKSPFGLQPTPAPVGSFDLAGTSQPGLNVTQGQAAAGMPVSAPGPFANMSGKDMFKYGSAAYSGTAGLAQPEYEPPKSTAMLRPYTYKFNPVTGAYDRTPGDTSERLYGESTFTPGPITQAAAGGLMSYMRETDFDDSDDMYAAGGLTAFKQGGKMQRPKGRPLASAAPYDFMSRDETMLQSVEKNFAKGGRFLVGDGDGMSDDIPAMIADKQPARLADGEFVIPADVVSHLGNGSSKAGAERLHDMMRKIRKERTGREKQAPAVKAEKFMPA